MASDGITITHEVTSEHKKKPDASHTCPRRSGQEPANRTQRNVQQARHIDTMVPCWYFIPISKSVLKLGRFSRTFAEITKCKELGSRSPQSRTPVPTGNLHHTPTKVKLKTNNVQLFLIIYCVVIKEKTFRSVFLRKISGLS